MERNRALKNHVQLQIWLDQVYSGLFGIKYWIKLELFEKESDMNCPFSMQVNSATHEFNKRSLDSLIAGLQTLQQC